MRLARLVLAAFALALALPLAARAQANNNAIPLPAYNPPPNAPDFGFTAGQKGLNFGLPAGGGPTIGFSYLLSRTAALEVNLGLGLQMTAPTAFNFSIELGYRAYFARIGDRLFPFFQPAFFLNRAGGVEEIALEAGIGVEYFLLEHFSVAGATGLAFQIGNLGGDGGASVALNTGTTALYANFYF